MKFATLGTLPFYLLICILCLSSCADDTIRKKHSTSIVAEETKNKLEQHKDSTTASTSATNLYY